jgi:hypothetical protein
MGWQHYLRIGVGILGLVVLVALLLQRRQRVLPFTRQPTLLSAGEMKFYRVLLQALPDGLVVFVKVRLMDVVAVPDDAWREYGAPGSGMHHDFVLANADTLEVRLVIELDDRSHGYGDAPRKDAYKNAALAAAGVRLLRVRAAARFDTLDLQRRIEAAL